MGYGTDGLTFNTLRKANLKRLPLFKDAKGRTCHAEYRRGYERGRASALLDAAAECERTGYDPRMSILRSEPAKEPPG